MITKAQLSILGTFKNDIFARMTFRQIKEKSKQSSNSAVQAALAEFKKLNILKSETIGNAIVYSLDISNNLTQAYLNLINESELAKKDFPKAVIKEIQRKVSRHTPFFILMVFGSHAKGKAKKSSDLDIAVIAYSEDAKKEITPMLETVKRREIIGIDYHVFTKDEFIEMLGTEYENVGKQIYRDSLICYGFIDYCQLISSAKELPQNEITRKNI